MLIVVTGPPAAGKSSWIAAHATARDIVIDLDLITRALTGPNAPAWNHDPIASRVALRARHGAIAAALEVVDQVDVYLIHSMPRPKTRKQYEQYNARFVVVDPGRDVVMQRVRDMRSPALARVATRWYRQYRKGGSRPVTRQASRAW